MAKREKKEKKLKENGEESDSKVTTILFTVLTILIWLVIFGVLIKLDVGGFGSKILRPVLKDVPVVNLILPPPSNEEVLEENNYKFKTLAEAIEYIKQLEQELAGYQESGNNDAAAIEELQSEIERLKGFEESQKAFEEEKQKYYEDVVLGNGTETMQSFKTYYESIDPATAEVIYQQVLEQLHQDEKMKEYAETYSTIDAASAALIFQEMTGDIDTVVSILENMDTRKRGAILSAIAENDAVFAAKLTQLLAP